jgi:hypothetical protein
MLISQRRLRIILGVLWLADGVLQLFPQMWTYNMINGIMVPIEEGQPGLIASSLHFIITQTTNHLVLVNLVISLVQIALGILLISGRWVKEAVIASIVWALIVWYGGEGMSMLLTGTASILSGAPGAVLLYPLLGLAVYPRGDGEGGIVSRLQLRWVLGGFWVFAALLQLQPYWWSTPAGEPGPISQVISSVVNQGGWDKVLIDPILSRLATLTAGSETLLNIVLILAFLTLGIGLLLAGNHQIQTFLIASIVLSLIIWYATEAFGMIFTGMSTDFNSGLLLVVIALACIPKKSAVATKEPVSRQVAEQIVG